MADAHDWSNPSEALARNRIQNEAAENLTTLPSDVSYDLARDALVAELAAGSIGAVGTLPGGATRDQRLGTDESGTAVWKQKNAPIVGMVDVTDYGYTRGKINDAVSSGTFAGSDVKWAVNAAIMATIEAEYAEAACDSATSTTVTKSGISSTGGYATWDDTIDAGAGADYSYEVCWLSGDQKGKWCYITAVAGDVITFTPHQYQNFAAPAAGDRFCVVKSARTQQRWADKCLWFPPGRAKVIGEIDGLRGLRGSYWMAAGYNTTILEGHTNGQHQNRGAFTGSTATTITDSTQNWTVNAKAGLWCAVWEKSTFGVGRQTLAFWKRIVSNTATELTLESAMTGVPGVADYDYGILERSVLNANGSAEACFTGIGIEVKSPGAFGTVGIYRFGWYNSWKSPSFFSTDAERVANSNTQNTFIRCLTVGYFRDAGFQYCNRGEGGTELQVDNCTLIDCRFKGVWEPISSTDRSFSVCCARLGGINGNAVINKVFGGASTTGQSGIIFETDITAIGHIVENCGVRTDQETGAYVVQGISHIASIRSLRLEGCSRLLGFATANVETTARLIVEDIDFTITSQLVFASDGFVVIWSYPGGVSMKNIRMGGDDPGTYATPRKVAFWFNNARGTYVDAFDIQVVQSNIEQAFPAGNASVIRLQGYKELSTSNTTDTTATPGSWDNVVWITGSVAPQSHVEQRPYFMVGGTAPDTVGPHRLAANVLGTQSGWLAAVPQAPGASYTVTDGHGLHLVKRLTLSSTQRLTIAGSSRMVISG